MTSSVQITPRKRKPVSDVALASGSASTPTKSPSARRRGPPTPNPPLVPFPTPPSSRQRKAQPSSVQDFLSSHPITPPATPSLEASRPSINKKIQLPPHLQTLLNLHHALNLAICLHIATHPPVLPPHSADTTQLQLKNLTNFAAVKDTVERSSGRRFGHAELGRLAWLWNWDGLSVDGPISEKSKANEDDNPFLVSSASTSDQTTCLSALTYLISPTRTLDPLSGRKTHTYGLGIELEVEQGETRQMLLNGAGGGLGNRGQGGGVRIIGRWTASGEERESVVRSRLERWCELHGGYEPPVSDLPTPSATGSTRSSIPSIPVLALPKLPSANLLPAANLFSTSTSTNLGPGLTTTPKKLAPSGHIGLSDPFVLDDKKGLVKGQIVRSGSVEERRAALYERIKARTNTKNTTLGSAIQRNQNLSAAEQQEELKRRSTLSRLEGIAESVWMIFSSSSSTPSTLSTVPTPPRGKRKVIPLNEVADIVVKSSKTPISYAEAKTSLEMLTQLCPSFLILKVVAKQEWLEMSTAIIPPSSPSGSNSRDADAISIGSLSPSNSRKVGAVAVGPASPGRVRRAGGLREVRERIRRELGE